MYAAGGCGQVVDCVTGDPHHRRERHSKT
jgi:hypothetical protein